MAAPHTLRTARLCLRQPRPDDAEAIFARYAADPVATRLMSWPTHRSMAETKAFLEVCEAEWTRAGVGAYLLEDPGSGQLLGSTGLHVTEPGEALTGYILAQDSWGRGLATEALQAMVELAPELGIRRLSAAAHPDNGASIRVLEKAGFIREPARERLSIFPNHRPGVEQETREFARYFASRL